MALLARFAVHARYKLLSLSKREGSLPSGLKEVVKPRPESLNAGWLLGRARVALWRRLP